jgi:hypothetical protein
MLPIDEYLIKRIDKGDIIVQGNPLEISKHHYEDGWCVTGNLRDREELEVEKSGVFASVSPGIAVRIKLPYSSFIDRYWYILEGSDF